MILLVLFIPFTFAKCGLWYEFNRDSSQSGPHTANSCRGLISCNYQYGWAFSFSYESLDKQEICNDLEMLEQCKRAQYMYDLFNIANNNSIITLPCANNIVCVAPLNLFPYRQNSRLKYWCQNIDSYNICMNIKNTIDNSNYPNKHLYHVSCTFDVSSDIQIFNYTKLDIITTTTSLQTFVNTTQTSLQTTTPSVSETSVIVNLWKLTYVILVFSVLF